MVGRARVNYQSGRPGVQAREGMMTNSRHGAQMTGSAG
jgi:hypothetical protein